MILLLPVLVIIIWVVNLSLFVDLFHIARTHPLGRVDVPFRVDEN